MCCEEDRSAVEDATLVGARKNSITMRESSWEPPGQNALKINIDGSMNDALATGGWGFIVRDSQGHALGVGAGYMLHVQDPLHVEAMACLESLQAAQAWGISEVHVETDASQLVQALRSTKIWR